MVDEYFQYLQRVFKHVNDSNKLKNIDVVCACGSTCKLKHYFNHCNSNKHNLYLIRNHKNYVYCIIDSNVNNNT